MRRATRLKGLIAAHVATARELVGFPRRVFLRVAIAQDARGDAPAREAMPCHHDDVRRRRIRHKPRMARRTLGEPMQPLVGCELISASARCTRREVPHPSPPARRWRRRGSVPLKRQLGRGVPHACVLAAMKPMRVCVNARDAAVEPACGYYDPPTQPTGANGNRKTMRATPRWRLQEEAPAAGRRQAQPLPDEDPDSSVSPPRNCPALASTIHVPCSFFACTLACPCVHTPTVLPRELR